MSAVQLGAPDPMQATDGQKFCGARSDVVVGMPAPFVCTRADGHTRRRVAEHVASGPYESRLPVALGVWVDGGAPRVMEPSR